MTQELNLIEQAIEKVAIRVTPSREQEIKRIIEALLFSSSEALSLEKIKEVIDASYPIRTRELQQLVEELSRDYRRDARAFQIDIIAGGYLLRTSPDMAEHIELLHQNKRGGKALSSCNRGACYCSL